MECVNLQALDNKRVVDKVIETNISKQRKDAVDENDASAKVFATAIAAINRKKIKDPRKQRKIFNRVFDNSK